MSGQKALIEAISETSGESKSAVERVLNALAGFVTVRLQSEEGEVTLPFGIGKLSRVHVDERQGRNPQTGEAITIQAHNRVKFKAAKALDDAVNVQR